MLAHNNNNNNKIVPASAYKEEIDKQFKNIQYSDKYFWYTGSIDNYDMAVKTEGDKFAFAIVDAREGLVGYISFRVDWYCSMAFNFSLINFKKSPMVMASAIREVMRMVESFNLHRIDFRWVEGNPASRNYHRIISLVRDRYEIRLIQFIDDIRDKQGEYHDLFCYELIRK